MLGKQVRFIEKTVNENGAEVESITWTIKWGTVISIHGDDALVRVGGFRWPWQGEDVRLLKVRNSKYNHARQTPC